MGIKCLGESKMRVVLYLADEDLDKMKMVYTSYLTPVHGEFTELEAKTALLACLDRAYVQIKNRNERCGIDGHN